MYHMTTRAHLEVMLLYSREVLEEQSPSRKHGIDAQLEASYRWAYCEFLKDAGMELKMCVSD